MSTEGKKTGRPLLDISENEVYRLSKVGCTDREIAELHGCDQQTISRRFSSVLTKGRVTLKRRLRRKQIELALKGDRTMLIWLGKQMLGQKEPPSVAIQNNVNNAAMVTARERTREEDIAFLKLEAEVRSKMPAPAGDKLVGGSK